MYTIEDFLVDLSDSTVWYKIPVSKVSADATEDQLYRHIIEDFSDLGLRCNGFTVEKINRVYYLCLTIELDTEDIDHPFEETSMTEFSKVFGFSKVTIPKKFADEVTCKIDIYDYGQVEVEFVFHRFEANNPAMLRYIKLG